MSQGCLLQLCTSGNLTVHRLLPAAAQVGITAQHRPNGHYTDHRSRRTVPKCQGPQTRSTSVAVPEGCHSPATKYLCLLWGRWHQDHNTFSGPEKLEMISLLPLAALCLTNNIYIRIYTHIHTYVYAYVLNCSILPKKLRALD